LLQEEIMIENATARLTHQFMFFQNQAHHEEKLIRAKSKIDNKLNDFSHICDIRVPSKKGYRWKERNNNIREGNFKILSKIYSIIYDSKKEFAQKYSQLPVNSTKLKNTMPLFHPYSYDSKIRSLNLVNRKKECQRINNDNFNLFEKIRKTKPTVPSINNVKKRDEQLKDIYKRIRKRDLTRPKTPIDIFPSITNRSRINPTLEHYFIRHDMLPRKDLENLQDEIEVIEKELTLREKLGANRASSNTRARRYHSKRASTPNINDIRLEKNEFTSYSVNVSKNNTPRGSLSKEGLQNNQAHLTLSVQRIETFNNSMEQLDDKSLFTNHTEQNNTNISQEMKKIERSYLE